jgi:hypothetical protein
MAISRGTKPALKKTATRCLGAMIATLHIKSSKFLKNPKTIPMPDFRKAARKICNSEPLFFLALHCAKNRDMLKFYRYESLPFLTATDTLTIKEDP